MPGFIHCTLLPRYFESHKVSSIIGNERSSIKYEMSSLLLVDKSQLKLSLVERKRANLFQIKNRFSIIPIEFLPLENDFFNSAMIDYRLRRRDEIKFLA